MKRTILKIVSREPPTQKRVPARIKDTLPPPIIAVAREPRHAGRGRHLDVDAVLARSLPTVVGEELREVTSQAQTVRALPGPRIVSEN